MSMMNLSLSVVRMHHWILSVNRWVEHHPGQRDWSCVQMSMKQNFIKKTKCKRHPQKWMPLLPLRRKYFLKNCPYGVQSIIKSLPLRRISLFLTFIIKYMRPKVNWFLMTFHFFRQYLYYLRISVIYSLQGACHKPPVMLYSFLALAHRPVLTSGAQSILLRRNF